MSSQSVPPAAVLHGCLAYDKPGTDFPGDRLVLGSVEGVLRSHVRNRGPLLPKTSTTKDPGYGHEISTRPRLTPEQVDLLENQFQAYHKPNTHVKRQLAERTGLTLPRVAVCCDESPWYPFKC